MNELIRPAGALPGQLADDVERAKDFARAEKAPATRRAYRSDWRIFNAWCAARGVEPLPAAAEAVAAFIATEAERGIKASTLNRRLAAIRYAHHVAGHESPTTTAAVGATLRGVKRTIGTARRQKAPATVDRLEAMLAAIRDTLPGARDRAMILIGFAGALRRSELVALEVDDIERRPQGIRLHIRRSKTDQASGGQVVPVLRGERHGPVRALAAWLAASEIVSGPLFRRIWRSGRVGSAPLSPYAVALAIKRHADAGGLDPDDFAGHSLRSGFLTSAATAGASIWRMMDVSRHRSVDTVRGYVRQAEEFEAHAAKGLL
jgi:integrase